MYLQGYLRGAFRLLVCLVSLIVGDQGAFALQDSATSPNQSEATARRFFMVLERSPRRGTALDRVYDHHIEAGSFDALIKELTERTTKQPDDGVAWLIMGLLQAKGNKHTAAIAAFEKAELHREMDALVPYYLAQSYLAADKQNLAMEALRRAISKKPPRTEVLEIYKTLGTLLQRARRTEEALKVWKELESLFPNDPRVPEQIAAILVHEGITTERYCNTKP